MKESLDEIIQMFFLSDIFRMSEESAPQFERRHHNPDDIIDGKPKWSKVVLIREKAKEDKVKTKTLNLDRLNPMRAEMEELDDNYGDDAGLFILIYNLYLGNRIKHISSNLVL